MVAMLAGAHKRLKAKRAVVLRGGLDPTPAHRAIESHLAALEQLRIWKIELRIETCSEPWVEARVYRRTPYPPKNDHPDPGERFTGMVRCVKCRRITPPQCVGSSGHCDDCRMGAMSLAAMANLPSSCSGRAMQVIRHFKLRVDFQETTGGE